MKFGAQQPAVDRKVVAVLILSAAVLLTFLGSRGLNEPDEGRFAEIGREMALQSTWLVPHLNGVPHFQKPPLTYWFMAVCIRMFGVNEWAVRLPSAIAAWGTIACAMFIAGRLFGQDARWKAGLILLSSFEFFLMARVITTDTFLTFWIVAAISGLVAYHTPAPRISAQGVNIAPSHSRAGLVAFYLCMGLGFLTKGPLALIVPCSAALGLRIGTRRSGGPLPRMAWLPGLILALMLGLSWFLVLAHYYPSLLKYFLGYELLERITSNVHDRSKPLYFYPLVIIAGFLPWSIFLPTFLKTAWQKRQTLDPAVVGLFIGWIAVPFLILSASNSKLATYVLSFFPAMSIAMANGWDRMAGQRAWSIALKIASWFFALLFLVSPLLVRYAEEVHQHHFPFMGGAKLGALACIVLFLALRLLIDSPARRHWILPWLAASILTMLLLCSSQVDGVLLGGNASMKPLAEQILQADKGGTPARVFMCSLRSNGMEFYLQRLVDRTEKSSDVVLPMDEETSARIVNDDVAWRHVKALSKMNAFVVVKESLFLENAVYRNWEVRGKSGTCVLISPRKFPE